MSLHANRARLRYDGRERTCENGGGRPHLLEDYGLGQYAAAFASNDVDAEVLRTGTP